MSTDISILKREFSAEDGTFLLKLRIGLEWDKLDAGPILVLHRVDGEWYFTGETWWALD